MKIRYLLVLILVIILSGCKAVYKLEIRDGVFKENININTAGDKSSLKYFSKNKFYAIMNGE